MKDDEIASLKRYIESNLGESSSLWELVIRPDIIDFISNLNQPDSEKFSIEILNWNENILYRLADEILFSKNEYINKSYLYCLIFLKTNGKENINYLLDNLFSCYNDLNIEQIPLEFFLQIKEKIKYLFQVKNEDEDDFIKKVNEVINDKMTKNKDN